MFPLRIENTRAEGDIVMGRQEWGQGGETQDTHVSSCPPPILDITHLSLIVSESEPEQSELGQSTSETFQLFKHQTHRIIAFYFRICHGQLRTWKNTKKSYLKCEDF